MSRDLIGLTSSVAIVFVSVKSMAQSHPGGDHNGTISILKIM